MDLPQLHVEALKAGDETAFEMIFRTYYPALCNYAFTYVRDKDEAEEIVQSCFLNVWEKRGSIDIHTSLKSYLYAMVRNAGLNRLKHEKIREKHAAEVLVTSETSSESVSQKIHASELETRIMEAMEKLPTQCRLVFKLSRFEELKYAEIAEQLNISIKTVENQIGKALKIMREQLSDYLPLIFLLIKLIT